eukprot:2724412-Rhodomonas_salina.1
MRATRDHSCFACPGLAHTADIVVVVLVVVVGGGVGGGVVVVALVIAVVVIVVIVCRHCSSCCRASSCSAQVTLTIVDSAAASIASLVHIHGLVLPTLGLAYLRHTSWPCFLNADHPPSSPSSCLALHTDSRAVLKQSLAVLSAGGGWNVALNPTSDAPSHGPCEDGMLLNETRQCCSLPQLLTTLSHASETATHPDHDDHARSRAASVTLEPDGVWFLDSSGVFRPLNPAAARARPLRSEALARHVLQ